MTDKMECVCSPLTLPHSLNDLCCPPPPSVPVQKTWREEAVKAEAHQPHSPDGLWFTLPHFLIRESLLTLFIKG